ncbi:response regulator [Granulicella arctica]|uniref:response regulator n=1 Tax=Granulicella arctica TaxID=940613 RepID=UPI0021DFEC19|nr:response regulator transcription factor [Granulicella arctica]
MPELNVLIADDHELIRRGVRDLLAMRTHWRVVGEACDGVEAVEKAVRLRPDIAILDFSMPRMNGPDAAAIIAKQVPEMGVIVLTMHDSEDVIRQVLRAGAHGMVLKSDADRNLLSAVEAVAAKRHFFTSRVSEMLLSEYMKATTVPESKRGAHAAPLTPREREVLRLLADGMTSKEVAAKLAISTRTVESHRVNINRKLGFASIADLVRYAIRNGIIDQN